LKITAYRKKLEELDRLKGELEKMEKSARMKKELSFISDINKVLKKHSKTAADLVAAFPAAKGVKSAAPTKAKPKAKPAKAKAKAKVTTKVKAKPKAKSKPIKAKAVKPGTKRVRKSPPTRKFKHPKTGAIIKAKRTNNKELKSWAVDLGVTVESMEVK